MLKSNPLGEKATKHESLTLHTSSLPSQPVVTTIQGKHTARESKLRDGTWPRS